MIATLAIYEAGPFCFLRCGACGCAGDIERDRDELSAAGVSHRAGCRVANALDVAGSYARTREKRAARSLSHQREQSLNWEAYVPNGGCA